MKPARVPSHPLDLTTEEVLAVLDGRKTRHRVAVHLPPEATAHGRRSLPDHPRTHVDPGGTDLFGPGPYLKLAYTGGDLGDEILTSRVRCPFRYPEEGAEVWIREEHALVSLASGYELDPAIFPCSLSGLEVIYRAGASDFEESLVSAWRPAKGMLKAASRLTRRITRVRLERLDAISVMDAWDEGLPKGLGLSFYRERWDHGRHWARWNDRPWTWVLEWEGA